MASRDREGKVDVFISPAPPKDKSDTTGLVVVLERGSPAAGSADIGSWSAV